MNDVLSRFDKEVRAADWLEISRMAKLFEIEFVQENEKSKEIKKRIRLTRSLIYEQLKSDDVERIVSKATFFTGLVETIDALEADLSQVATTRSDFLIFLKALLKKIRQEKLIVFKPRERRNVFDKMKKAGEE